MIEYMTLAQVPPMGPSAVTIGKFEGLHRGHQKLFDAIRRKKEEGLTSVVVTIDVPGGKRLCTEDERRQLLSETGIDVLIHCPLDPAFMSLRAARFAEEILAQTLGTRYLAVGTDFRFGYKREGSAQMLFELGQSLGFATDIIEKECYLGEEISSTRVRAAVADGDMELARALLGRAYSVSGSVRHGAGIGRKISAPTVNILPAEEKLLPPDGVYVTQTTPHSHAQKDHAAKTAQPDVRSADAGLTSDCSEENRSEATPAEKLPGVTDIGVRPTVGGGERRVETHLLAFDRDLYGEALTTELLYRLRGEVRFDSLEALEEQIRTDAAQAAVYLDRLTD